MSIVHRVRSFSMSSSKGTIYLSDGKTRVRDVVREGLLVEDVVELVCNTLSEPISPVARLYFGVCDMKTGLCLSPYSAFTAADTKRPFQLRVFVNAGQNGFQFQKTSKAAYKYYLSQLKEDFVKGQLYMLSVNTAMWMAAIDMAREAAEKRKKYEDFTRNQRELQRFMPIQLSERWREDQEVKDQLKSVFDKFYGPNTPANPDHFKAKFIEVYEKDEMCGTYIFKLKQSSPRGQHTLLVVSPRKGISKMRRIGTQNEEELVCQFEQLESIRVDNKSLAVTICITAKEGGVKVIFTEKQELVAFAVVVDTYFRLLVDANTVIMDGDLRPPEKCFLVGEGDGQKKDLCHACIGPEAVEKVLTKFHMENGHFMVRESRNKDGAFTLSLCHEGSVLNYRIVRHEDGMLCLQDPNSETAIDQDGEMFPTLHSLLEKHKHKLNGLPTYLKMNCSPNVTGRIPILPREECDSDVGSTATQCSPAYSIIADLKAVGVTFIEYEEFETIGELGQGHFSTVYRAVWKTNNSQVAIKVPTMKDSNAEAVMKELKREIETMYKLSHPNIVRLLGITQTQHFLTFIGQFPMVVMEFVEKGSLRDYLNKLRKGNIQLTSPEVQVVLLRFSQQIADGMKYLEKEKVVHRDLATRNVLVVSDEQVKISDFGLARQRFEEKEYYQGKDYKDLPIYWYAPECLDNLKFTHKSDVWSFGVTVWEIFTIGDLPLNYLYGYIKERSASQAFSSLARFYKTAKGNRLPMNHLRCPEGVREGVCDLISKCWELDPLQRPSFDNLTLEFALMTTSIP